MKPMTFEEWWDDGRCGGIGCDMYTDTAKALFDRSRVGMIPEDGTICIPLESEWPEWVSGIEVRFVSGLTTRLDTAIMYPRIKLITRSKPAWVPKVGEAVFCDRSIIGVVMADTTSRARPDEVVVLCQDGRTMIWPVAMVKPFNPAYIGKPWSEIPGGANE